MGNCAWCPHHCLSDAALKEEMRRVYDRNCDELIVLQSEFADAHEKLLEARGRRDQKEIAELEVAERHIRLELKIAGRCCANNERFLALERLDDSLRALDNSLPARLSLKSKLYIVG